ncbi:MAG: GNAT family N-acetyltransferase [Alphaproteobacteria bacterium]|nr:GNAT family N-acetyltransferase [Alphaproteobacteria bacterium]
MTAAITVDLVLAPTPAVRELVGELEAELSRHYPAEQRHGLALDAIFAPHIRFFVAAVGGRPAGCGGVALLEDFAELKRMYVRPEFRGRGVADAILDRLTRAAVAAGHSLFRLETGTKQDAAMRFYARHGFERRGPFEPYASMPTASILGSVFMEKRTSSAT